MTEIGHNSGARDTDAQRRHDLNVIAISTWVGRRRVEEAISRKQLGDLSGLDRLVTLRNATLDNMHQFYLSNPAADAAAGVLTMICLLSDNSDGCCTVSVTRIAQFLCRSDRAISLALKRLEEDGCIKVERRRGASSLVWPVINPVYADHKDPMTWVLDAHAPTDRHVAPQKAVSGVAEPPKAVSGVINFPTKTMPDFPTPEGCFAPETGFAPEAGRHEPPKAVSDDTTIDTTTITTVVPYREVGSPSAPAVDESQIDIEEAIEGANQRLVEAVEAEPVEGEVITPGKRTKAAAGKRAPKKRSVDFPAKDYWSPDDLQYGVDQGLTAEQVRAEFKNFRDHHVSKGNTFVCWRSAWQKWCRNAVAWKRPVQSGRAQSRMSDADIMDNLFNNN